MSDDISRSRWNHSSPGKYGHTTVAQAAGSSSSRCAIFGRLSQSAFTQHRSPAQETENASTARTSNAYEKFEVLPHCGGGSAGSSCCSWTELAGIYAAALTSLSSATS